MSTIGTRIRELRQAKGLTQDALAGDGVSAGYVSLIESGKRTPSRDVIQRLAARLGVPAEQLLDRAEPRVDDQAKVEINFARMALANGNPAEAARCLSPLVFDQLNTALACDAALVLAESLWQTGQLDEAVAMLESMSARCRDDDAWLALAVCATRLTVMYLESGDTERGVSVGENALAETEAAGLEGTDEHLRLGATCVWAIYERGDLLHATSRVQRLIRVADRVGTSRARGSVYWNASMVAHGRGRLDDALRLSDRALAMLGEDEASRDLPRLRLHYAWLLLHRDQPLFAEALEQLDRAETDTALLGSRVDIGLAATLRGRAYLYLGDADRAAEHAARALQLLGPSDHVNRAEALILLGDVGVARGEDDLVDEAYRETERVLGEMTESRMVARLWRELGDALRERGDVNGAVNAYDNALRMTGLLRRPLSNFIIHLTSR